MSTLLGPRFRMQSATALFLLVSLNGASISLLPASRAETHGSEIHGSEIHGSKRNQLGSAETEDLRILAIADLRGALERPPGFQGKVTQGDNEDVPAGGAAHLATTIEKLRVQSPHSILLSTGNAVGGTQPENVFLGQEPSIQAMNYMGVDASGVGTYDLQNELAGSERLLDASCHPDGVMKENCPHPVEHLPDFHGARFPVVSANDVGTDTPDTALPFSIVRAKDVSVGVISVSSEQGAATKVNKAAASLDFLGIKTVIALINIDPIHSASDLNSCAPALSQHREIRALSELVDSVIVGNSGGPSVCGGMNTIDDDRVIIAPASHGRSVGVIDLQIDRATGEVVPPLSTAFNQLVSPEIKPNQQISELTARSIKLSGNQANSALCELKKELGRGRDGNGFSALATALATAEHKSQRSAGAELGVANEFGPQASLAAGPLSYRAAYTALPWGDRVGVLPLTGRQLLQLLNVTTSTGDWRFTPSENVTLVRSSASRLEIAADKVRIDGKQLDLTKEYKVAVNDYVAKSSEKSAGTKASDYQQSHTTDVDAIINLLRERSGT